MIGFIILTDGVWETLSYPEHCLGVSAFGLEFSAVMFLHSSICCLFLIFSLLRVFMDTHVLYDTHMINMCYMIHICVSAVYGKDLGIASALIL